MANRWNIGVVGCGRISRQYLSCLQENFPAVIHLERCADIHIEAAQKVAEEYGIAKESTPDDLYADPTIDAVLNLTNPWAHAEVASAALRAGKHTYGEKPLTLDRDAAREVLELADKLNLRVGCAPDTFLGAGLQTCRKLIDEGWIGRPLMAHATITMSVTSERYNSPAVGGVVMDMGPYYVTALVHLFGPVRRVMGFCHTRSWARRNNDMRSSEFGAVLDATSPTTAVGVLEFDDGVLATFAATADGTAYGPRLEIVGSEGNLTANDPNMFGGPVTVHRRGSDPAAVPPTHQYTQKNRGIGLVEMLFAEAAGRPHRASAELGYHVMDVLLGLQESSVTGQAYLPARDVAGRPVMRPEALLPGHTNNPFG